MRNISHKEKSGQMIDLLELFLDIYSKLHSKIQIVLSLVKKSLPKSSKIFPTNIFRAGFYLVIQEQL